MATINALQAAIVTVLTGSGFVLNSTENLDGVLITHWGGNVVSCHSLSYAFIGAGLPCDWDLQHIKGDGWIFYAPENPKVSRLSKLEVLKVA